MSVTLTDIRAVQPEWFSRKNKRFFGDVGYKLLHGKSSKQPFLVRSTYAWSDMFGQPKRLTYRINAIEPDLTIGSLVENGKEFRDMFQVKEWLEVA